MNELKIITILLHRESCIIYIEVFYFIQFIFGTNLIITVKYVIRNADKQFSVCSSQAQIKYQGRQLKIQTRRTSSTNSNPIIILIINYNNNITLLINNGIV